MAVPLTGPWKPVCREVDKADFWWEIVNIVGLSVMSTGAQGPRSQACLFIPRSGLHSGKRRWTLVGCQYGRNDARMRHPEKLLGKTEVVKNENTPELSHLIIWVILNLIKYKRESDND